MADDTFAGVETANTGIITSRVCLAQGSDVVLYFDFALNEANFANICMEILCIS